MKKILSFFLFILIIATTYTYISSGAGISQSSVNEEDVLSENKRPNYNMGKLIIKTADGRQINYNVEIADDYTKRAYGLMHVKTMPADRGMIFAFDDEKIRDFWMKNTFIALDIIYVGSDFTIKHIAKDTTPHSLEMINSIYPAKYVIELNAGDAVKNKISPGDKIEFFKEKSNFVN